MDAFNLSHFSACMYPCIIAKQGLYKKKKKSRYASVIGTHNYST